MTDTDAKDWSSIDYFSDPSLIEDPYPYFEDLRAQCPVLHLDHLGVVAVTGYDEANEVYRDTESFSSCISVVGPFAQFTTAPAGDDLTQFVAEHRTELPMFEHMVTMDPPQHTQERAILMRLITPKRLKQNEEFMWRIADELLDDLLPAGSCEFITAYAQPFAMLAVADLLGVPEEDHQRFIDGFGLQKGIGKLGKKERSMSENPLHWADDLFTHYLEDRRAEPRKDVLTDLALATYPDGSTPPVVNVVRTATFLFAAGQETTARLLAAALKHLSEHPELQDVLREDRDKIPPFLEEVLRLESPVKTDFRMALKSATVGGVDIAAGTPVMLLNGAANRDPDRFECPHEFQIDRANAQSHLAFGRGVHSCPGGPLARAEARISLEKILDRMGNIRLAEDTHGPAGDHRFDYEATWVLRGLSKLHIEFDQRG